MRGDPAGADWRELGQSPSAEKMAKLAAIFSVWQQPDAAAELLLPGIARSSARASTSRPAWNC